MARANRETTPVTIQQNTDRIQTTHIGSLPRPHALLDMMKAKFAGQPYDEKAYDATITKAVADSVRKQVECGIDIVTDGEFSKPGFFTYIQERLEGFEVAPEPEDDAVPAGGRGLSGILRAVFQGRDDGRRDRADHAGGLRRAGQISRREAICRSTSTTSRPRPRPRACRIITYSCRRPRRRASASTSITSPTKNISTRSRPS